MCKKPLVLKDRVVKCNHCIECLIERSQEWAFRLEEESKDAQSGIFLTLTYDEQNIPLVYSEEKDEMLSSLHKKDLQNFLKRLRKAQFGNKGPKDWKKKIRYFACGEYGEKTKRAHYHAIIFNIKKSVVAKLPEIWKEGHIKVGEVTPKSIRYVSNYMLLKDIDCEKEQQKPFTLMSKKPIIGAGYVVRNYCQHKETGSEKLIHPSKIPKNLYRSLENKIFTEQEKIDQRNKRVEAFEKLKKKVLEKAEKESPLDPPEYIRQQKENKEFIRKSRQKKRKL